MKTKNFFKNHKTELLLGVAAVVLGGALIYERLVPRTYVVKLDALKDFGWLFEDGWKSACEHIAKNGLEGAEKACPEITSLIVRHKFY